MTLYLCWIFLWLVTGERTKGLNISDCITKKLLWEYSSGSEKFVLFCDLTESQKSHFHHRRQLSPTQAPENLPCSGSKDLSDVQWYFQPQNGNPLGEITNNYHHIIQDKSILHFSTTGMHNAGSYICRPRIRSPQGEACCVKTILEVKPKTNVSCVPNNFVSHEQQLLIGSTAYINCPSFHCQSDAQSSEVTWYKNGKLLSEERSNSILVDEVYDHDQGIYVCDYTDSDNTSSWTVRAVVQVTTIVKDTIFKPDILDPIKDTLEVELGKPLTLNCTARFGYQRDFKPVIKWYIKDSDQEWEVPTPEQKRVKYTKKDDVIERVVHLKEVTQRDLHRKFVCFAQNSIGNTTQSIQLREKKGDKKVFDAFVSYAKWSSFESEATSSLHEEYLALNLFPEVLENKYGYNLCLLERDVAPGGAYAEDIVNIIKKSRRGIFILSPNYVNGPSVFELQAAVNLALDDQTLKLILIKFCSFQEPESLPHLVKKALRVLPTVTWRGLKSVPPNSRFWTQMRYHMPVKNSKGFRWNHLRIMPEFFSLEMTP
ncbi:interleukin-18 receptor accessory protein isoform X2 [Leopardus geoffroyi]|uniref:interleukin-18 receptor accessory protein isoform X2 n=1 Tax=Leopardus geoffroyi TaxID=46844 RepID=UPI001E265352|nr:interleukin-18 receptor accessory protein isoform X2 [Leopardus geoffroyi]